MRLISLLSIFALSSLLLQLVSSTVGNDQDERCAIQTSKATCDATSGCVSFFWGTAPNSLFPTFGGCSSAQACNTKTMKNRCVNELKIGGDSRFAISGCPPIGLFGEIPCNNADPNSLYSDITTGTVTLPNLAVIDYKVKGRQNTADFDFNSFTIFDFTLTALQTLSNVNALPPSSIIANLITRFGFVNNSDASSPIVQLYNSPSLLNMGKKKRFGFVSKGLSSARSFVINEKLFNVTPAAAPIQPTSISPPLLPNLPPRIVISLKTYDPVIFPARIGAFVRSDVLVLGNATFPNSTTKPSYTALSVRMSPEATDSFAWLIASSNQQISVLNIPFINYAVIPYDDPVASSVNCSTISESDCASTVTCAPFYYNSAGGNRMYGGCGFAFSCVNAPARCTAPVGQGVPQTTYQIVSGCPPLGRFAEVPCDSTKTYINDTVISQNTFVLADATVTYKIITRTQNDPLNPVVTIFSASVTPNKTITSASVTFQPTLQQCPPLTPSPLIAVWGFKSFNYNNQTVSLLALSGSPQQLDAGTIKMFGFSLSGSWPSCFTPQSSWFTTQQYQNPPPAVTLNPNITVTTLGYDLKSFDSSLKKALSLSDVDISSLPGDSQRSGLYSFSFRLKDVGAQNLEYMVSTRDPALAQNGLSFVAFAVDYSDATPTVYEETTVLNKGAIIGIAVGGGICCLCLIIVVIVLVSKILK